MYAHTRLTTCERGSGSLPTTAASCSEGCMGRMNAALGLRAVFGFALAVDFFAFVVVVFAPGVKLSSSLQVGVATRLGAPLEEAAG